MPTPFLPSDTMRVLLVDPDGVPYDIAGIIGMGEFFPSDTARVVLVDADGNPYKATGGGGGGATIQVEGVDTADQTLANFVSGTPATLTITNPSGGIIQFDVNAPGTGTVTQVDTANGITGGPITTTGTISGINAAADGSTKGVAAFTASDFNSASGVISIDYANGQKATALQPGFLTAADWSTFNGKQAAGNYITALTGDVTASGPGSAAATIANNAVTTVKINNTAVTLAKIQNATANSKLLGSGAAGSGASYSELTLGTNLSMSGTTLNASGSGTVFFSEPGLRLTTESGVPVSTSNRTAQGTLYWTPMFSGNVWYWDGAAWQVETITEKSLALTVTSGKNYDVFYLHGTGLVLSSAWTNDTTRADALGTQDGVTVLSSDHTKLWIGTIRASGANVIEDSATKRFLWNSYNQCERHFLRQESSVSWTYNSTTPRQANGSSSNQVEVVSGGTQNAIRIEVSATGTVTNGVCVPIVQIGKDSTTEVASLNYRGGALATEWPANAVMFDNPFGYHAYLWLERLVGSGIVTFYGTGNDTSTTSGIGARLIM